MQPVTIPCASGFHMLLCCDRFTANPQPLIMGPPLVRFSKPHATEPHSAKRRHPGRDSFTLRGVFSLGARGQPLHSRARCDWSPCDGPRLQSWHGTAPRRCYLGLQEARTSKKETRKVALLPQTGAGTDQHPTASVTSALWLQPSHLRL